MLFISLCGTQTEKQAKEEEKDEKLNIPWKKAEWQQLYSAATSDYIFLLYYINVLYAQTNFLLSSVAGEYEIGIHKRVVPTPRDTQRKE